MKTSKFYEIMAKSGRMHAAIIVKAMAAHVIKEIPYPVDEIAEISRPAPATFAIETLGCKVNQYETSYLIETLIRAGLKQVPFREQADVYIVHSCAVTAKAGFQSRQLLRRARRANPGALIVAAGCYAQLDSERIAREQLATHILGNSEKFDLASLLSNGNRSAPCDVAKIACTGSCPEFTNLPVSKMHTGRTRAMLKIQDGCDSFCSYCVVPLVRGRCRSLGRAETLDQMERLVEAGYEEIVLTGIHLGQWGRDLDPPQSLSKLLRAIDSRPHPPRLRLSSLEPMEIDDELIGLISSLSWICPHFHIPLQSGDSEILNRMRRPYDPSHYSGLVTRIHGAVPDAAIGADVMVGFPGETERQFENTCELIESLPISYLHVFPYSPRPGTPAAGFSEQVRSDVLKRRAAALKELGARKKREFRQQFVGKILEVLIEKKLGLELWEGLSGNYINTAVRTDNGDHSSDSLAGSIIFVRITGFRGEDLQGEPHRPRP